MPDALIHPQQRAECRLSGDQLDLYFGPARMPRNYQRDATNELRLSTVFHMLSRAHKLPQHMQDKGIVGQVFQSDCSYRWPTRYELAVVCGFPRGFANSLGELESRAHFGNCVVPGIVYCALYADADDVCFSFGASAALAVPVMHALDQPALVLDDCPAIQIDDDEEADELFAQVFAEHDVGTRATPVDA